MLFRSVSSTVEEIEKEVAEDSATESDRASPSSSVVTRSKKTRPLFLASPEVEVEPPVTVPTPSSATIEEAKDTKKDGAPRVRRQLATMSLVRRPVVSDTVRKPQRVSLIWLRVQCDGY